MTERLPGDPPSPYELQYGFSRVVRAGQQVRIGGTTSVDEYGAVHGDTPYEQTKAILAKIEHELGRAGVALTDVIETHVYVTDISRGEEVGRAHGEIFGSIKPWSRSRRWPTARSPRFRRRRTSPSARARSWGSGRCSSVGRATDF